MEKRKKVAYEYRKKRPYVVILSVSKRNGTNPIQAVTPIGIGGKERPRSTAVTKDKPVRNLFC